MPPSAPNASGIYTVSLLRSSVRLRYTPSIMTNC